MTTLRRTLYPLFLFAIVITLFIPTIVHAETISIPNKYKEHPQFIIIDKSLNQLTYFEKGKAVKTFSVATGKKPSYTPEGLFKINEKIKNRPYYKGKIKGGDPRNPLGDRWLGLEIIINGKQRYGYAIHGNNDAKSIGKYVSAGCIRMHNKEIHWLYGQVSKNTPVLIQK